MTSPVYIVFEGTEGCGKTTQASLLAESFRLLDPLTVLTRETGGTDIGARIRDVLHDIDNVHLDPIAEALLIAGDRAQHRAEILAPAQGAGHHVISDRSVYSTIAYQGYGRELPLDMVRLINNWALADRWPDLIIYLDISHEQAIKRLADRKLDRFEQEDTEFFQRVRSGFQTMADNDPDRWLVINANDSPEAIHSVVRSAVQDRLGLLK